MKITFVLPVINLAGGVRVVFEYANRLNKLGHHINIIYPVSFPALRCGRKSRPIKDIFHANIISLLKKNNIDWFDLQVKLIKVPSIDLDYVGFVKYLVPDADIIIATSWETAYFVNAMPCAKGDKFYFIQHYEIWDIWNNIECWKKAKLMNECTKNLPKVMSYIEPSDDHLKKIKKLVDQSYFLPLKKIVISGWLKELITERFGLEVQGLIPNGINFETFHCNGQKSRPSQRSVVIMPYRDIPWKGDSDGLKALKMARETYGDSLEIRLYGRKGSLDSINWAKFYEQPDDEQLRDLYCSSDIFVYPSWVEGFGLPPMEAMACGCAVVTTDVGAVPEYSIPGKTAIVVPPHDPKALYEGIAQLLDNRAKAEVIAAEGNRFIKQYTWDKSVKTLEEILKCNTYVDESACNELRKS